MFVLFSLATTLFFGLHSLYLKYNPEQPAITAERVFKDPSKITKHIRINNVDYSIPVSYFNTRVPPWTVDESLYLLTVFPDFSAPSPQQAREYMSGKTHVGFSLLVTDQRFIKTVDQIAKFRLENEKRTTSTGSQFGLDVYNTENQVGTGRLVPYLAKENGRIVTLITCSEEKIKGLDTVRPSFCTHYFSDKALLYHISYFKEYLPHWKKIENAIRALFIGFHEGAIEKGLDKAIVAPNKINPRIFTLKEITHPEQEK